MKKLILALLLCSAVAFPQSAGVGQIWTALSGTLQSGATASGNGTAMSVNGLSSAVVTVNCSVACAGGTTINFEGSGDGTNFVALNAVQLGTGTVATTILNQGTTITAWQIPIGGLQSIRARISGYSAGTITVTANATAAPYDPKVLNSNLFLGGTAADGNSGSKSPQTLRVAIATDQPQLAAKLLVTPDSVALPANQSMNEAQINGVTPLMGNGTTGTGSPRVTIASDNTPFAVNATLAAETTKVIGTVRAQGNLGAAFDAATGAAPPANAILMGGLASGATGGFVTAIPVCDSFANINISTATTTLLVTGVSGRHVRICHIDMIPLAADNVGIISGTGATCGTGSAAIVGTTSATGYNMAANGGIAAGSGLGQVMRTVATGDSVCLITSAATQLSGVIAYTIY